MSWNHRKSQERKWFQENDTVGVCCRWYSNNHKINSVRMSAVEMAKFIESFDSSEDSCDFFQMDKHELTVGNQTMYCLNNQWYDLNFNGTLKVMAWKRTIYNVISFSIPVYPTAYTNEKTFKKENIVFIRWLYYYETFNDCVESLSSFHSNNLHKLNDVLLVYIDCYCRNDRTFRSLFVQQMCIRSYQFSLIKLLLYYIQLKVSYDSSWILKR